MKLILILIATLASIPTIAQDTKVPRKILIGFNFSPDYSYRTLKNRAGAPSNDLVIKNRNDIEVAKFGYATGINICFNFSQLIGFEAGLQFSNKGYQTQTLEIFFFAPEPNLPTKVKFVHSYQYIGIPLKAKFSLTKGKLGVFSSVGFTTNFLLNVKSKAIIEYSNGKTEKNSQSLKNDFNKVDISPLIGIGIDYRLNRKMHLLAEPTFRYGLIKTIDAPISEKLWSAGLNIGFYYAVK